MHRRIAPLVLAVLVAFPVAAPASAAKPQASPSPQPSAAPSAEPTPSAAPSSDPTPSAAPDVQTAPSPSPEPSANLATTPAAPPAAGQRPDATGRYIVILKTGADTAAVVAKASKRDGVKADHHYSKAIRGFAAKLDKHQKADLLADPDVAAIVPDEVIQVTGQTVPTGVSRIGGRLSDIAAIDGHDTRVDADVAIVDTGISAHPDLNVAGGYNCSTADHTAWRDMNDHGTHVAGTVAALDNGFGVVGVAPGARVWGVKILNDDGYGLISWYVCGLDWILAQRDPVDASRPLFEAVNMSVTKPGSDDKNCGLTNNDVLHQAICRVVAGGITVVAAAANDSHDAKYNVPASYDEVITVSALADTDGKPGGLGGNACYSWGGYDKDDTFADFSNYGGDVDLIAPGKCILSTIPGGYGVLSGTSMAAPAVTGAVALYKASRPKATPAEVREALRYLGNLNWKTSTDPDTAHEPLLDVSRIGALGTFALAPGSAKPPTIEGNTTVSLPFSIVRSPTFFERVALSVAALPTGWKAVPVPSSVMGWTANAATLSVSVPKGTAPGPYTIDVQGTNQGRTLKTTLTVNVVQDLPTARPPIMTLMMGELGWRSIRVLVQWPAATDPTSPIAGYQLEKSTGGTTWSAPMSFVSTQQRSIQALAFDTSYWFRVRAVDSAGNWSPWAVEVVYPRIHVTDDRSSRVIHRGTWSKSSSGTAWRGTLTGSGHAGASLRMAFTGHSVAVAVPRSRTGGSARVYIDGIYVRTISTYSTLSMGRQILFTREFPAGGAHTITVVAVGTGTRPVFRLDAFVVSR
jgi:subtilisin